GPVSALPSTSKYVRLVSAVSSGMDPVIWLSWTSTALSWVKLAREGIWPVSLSSWNRSDCSCVSCAISSGSEPTTLLNVRSISVTCLTPATSGAPHVTPCQVHSSVAGTSHWLLSDH